MGFIELMDVARRGLRSCLLQTGRYSMHNTIVDWIPPASPYGLPLNETTMAQLFTRAGYISHAVGKCQPPSSLTFSPSSITVIDLVPLADVISSKLTNTGLHSITEFARR